jgi:hypothetical protein
MRTRRCESSSERNRIAENSHLTKHVVAADFSAKDAGSTPAASTIFFPHYQTCQSGLRRFEAESQQVARFAPAKYRIPLQSALWPTQRAEQMFIFCKIRKLMLRTPTHTPNRVSVVQRSAPSRGANAAYPAFIFSDGSSFPACTSASCASRREPSMRGSRSVMELWVTIT